METTMAERNIVLLDIDHTIADAAWRDFLLGSWDEYHTQSAADKPASDMVELVRCLHAGGAEVVALTARPEKWRHLTISWLMKNKVMYDVLLMRPNDDYDDSPTMKLKEIARHLGSGWRKRVICIVDDREDVTQAFVAEGVTALQCYGRNYADSD